MTSDQKWIVRPHRESLWHNFKEIVRRRHLIALLARQQIYRVYQKAILGVVWLAIRPLVMVIGATVLVRDILGVSTDPVPYQVYILGSFAPWILFQRGMTWTTKSLPSFKRLMRQFYFPRLILHMTNMSPAFVESGVVGICFLIGLGFFWVTTGTLSLTFGWHSLFLLPCLVLILLLVFGVSAFTSVLNTMARDTWYTLRYILGIWMILTPIFYPLSAIPEKYHLYLLLNPMAPLIMGVRWALFQAEAVPWTFFWIAVAVIMTIAACGAWFFVKWEAWALDRA